MMMLMMKKTRNRLFLLFCYVIGINDVLISNSLRSISNGKRKEWNDQSCLDEKQIEFHSVTIANQGEKISSILSFSSYTCLSLIHDLFFFFHFNRTRYISIFSSLWYLVTYDVLMSNEEQCTDRHIWIFFTLKRMSRDRQTNMQRICGYLSTNGVRLCLSKNERGRRRMYFFLLLRLSNLEKNRCTHCYFFHNILAIDDSIFSLSFFLCLSLGVYPIRGKE